MAKRWEAISIVFGSKNYLSGERILLGSGFSPGII
jgi:hypothetical protein